MVWILQKLGLVLHLPGAGGTNPEIWGIVAGVLEGPLQIGVELRRCG